MKREAWSVRQGVYKAQKPPEPLTPVDNRAWLVDLAGSDWATGFVKTGPWHHR